MVESIACSSREPRFDPQPLHGGLLLAVDTGQAIQLLLASKGTSGNSAAQTSMQTKHSCINNKIKKQEPINYYFFTLSQVFLFFIFVFVDFLFCIDI